MPESKIDSVCPFWPQWKIFVPIFRLDLQHDSFKIMLDGKLNLAPISNPQRVLDLATGTGIWAIEFGLSFPLLHFAPFSHIPAEEHPEAAVLGTDLSPIQPDL